MPGKPFRSSLEPHFDEIAQRRARRETWQGIAAELEKGHGLKVHFSAVQKFFGRHLARPRPLGFVPLPTAATTTDAAPTDTTTLAEPGGEEVRVHPQGQTQPSPIFRRGFTVQRSAGFGGTSRRQWTRTRRTPSKCGSAKLPDKFLVACLEKTGLPNLNSTATGRKKRRSNQGKFARPLWTKQAENRTLKATEKPFLFRHAGPVKSARLSVHGF